jgi:hypothetical protein
MRVRKHSRSSKAEGQKRPPEQNVRDAVADCLTRLRTGVVVPNSRRGQAIKSLLESASINLYLGYVQFVGVDASGQGTVSFTNTWDVPVGQPATYTESDWPQPFFELAKTALLSGKQISVLSNGKPEGDSVISVGILSQPE